MLDAQILAAVIASREAYEKVKGHITADDMTVPGKPWWRLVEDWYQRDPQARGIDKAALFERGKMGIQNPKHQDTILGFFKDLPEAVSPENTAQVALELKRFNVGMSLGAAIAGHDYKAQTRLMAEYAELMKATDLGARAGPKVQVEEAASIEDLFTKVGKKHKIPVHIQAVNKRLDGGVEAGDHLIVFGRPESGKSMFALSIAGGFVLGPKKKVCYFGNEDRVNKLKYRAVGRITSLTPQQIEADPAKAIDIYRKRGAEDLWKFYQLRNGRIDDMRPILDREKPDIIVLDQLRNMQSSADASTVERLNSVAMGMRELLNEYEAVGISVMQAGASAGLWLGMEDMDGSKTGVPGAADTILGVGVNAEYDAKNLRAISFPKNKLNSADDAHEGVTVEIDKLRSKYL